MKERAKKGEKSLGQQKTFPPFPFFFLFPPGLTSVKVKTYGKMSLK